MEIATGVHRIDTPLGERVSCLYLFTGPRHSLLFDLGVDGAVSDYVLPYLTAIGSDPGSIHVAIASHNDIDHWGGMADAREVLPNVALIAHAEDAPQIEDYEVFEATRARQFREEYGWDEDPEALRWIRTLGRATVLDGTVKGGQRFDLGDREIEVVHLPGHSQGHLSIHDPDNDMLAISDAVLGDAVPLADGSPAFPPTYRYVSDYLDSIAAVESLDVGSLLTAHYGRYDGDAVSDFLTLSRDFVHDLEAAVLTALSEAARGMTVAELLSVVGATFGSWPREGTLGALVFPVVGHLELLTQMGQIVRGSRDGFPVFSYGSRA